MKKPEDYDFVEVLQKAQDDGVFETLRIRDFSRECPIDGPKCTIGISDSGKVGIFYDGSYGHCGEGYREIGRDEVPLNWFTDYAVYTSWDVWTSDTESKSVYRSSLVLLPVSLRGWRGGERPAIDRYVLFRWKRYISDINQVHIAYHDDIYIERDSMVQRRWTEIPTSYGYQEYVRTDIGQARRK